MESAIWCNFVTLHLIDNVRLSENDDEFKNWLLDIGDGIFSDKNEELLNIINIPEDIVCVNNMTLKLADTRLADTRLTLLTKFLEQIRLTLAMTVLTPN